MNEKDYLHSVLDVFNQFGFHRNQKYINEIQPISDKVKSNSYIDLYILSQLYFFRNSDAFYI